MVVGPPIPTHNCEDGQPSFLEETNAHAVLDIRPTPSIVCISVSPAQALSAVPQTSSKWIDLHRDIALAQDLSGGDISTKPLLPLLPSLTVETLPLSVDSFGSLKIKPTIRGREVAGVRGSEFKYRRRVARRNEQTAEARRKD